MDTFSIGQTTKAAPPRLPYKKIKDDILGTEYVLSLMFIGEARATKLNRTYRRKTYVPNVLSFPLDVDAGEVFITLSRAQREAAAYGMTPRQYVAYLFIHACLHLKGYHHGDTMDEAEKRYLRAYSLAPRRT